MDFHTIKAENMSMGRSLFYSLLIGNILLPHSLIAETVPKHTVGENFVAPRKDDADLPELERRRVLQEDLNFIKKDRLAKVPAADKNKFVARTEDASVDKDKVIVDSSGNPLRNDKKSANKEIFVEEIVNFTAQQTEDAINFVMRNNDISDEFAKFTKDKTDLKDAFRALDRQGAVVNNTPGVVKKDAAASLYLEKDPARVAYLAVAFKFKLETERMEERVDHAAEAKNSADASNTRLSSSLAAGNMGFNSNPVAAPDLNSLTSSYLDLAAKQIVNASSDRSSLKDDQNLASPFKGATELNKMFDNAINAANSLDLGTRSMSEKIQPFKDLIRSKDFLENGTKLLGKENAETLVSSVQAAELLEEASGNVNATGINYLSGAFNMGTGVSSPPCIGCVENKGSGLPAQAEAYTSADEYVNSTTQEWIDEARYISDIVNRNKNMDPQQVAALNKGRSELEKLIQTLDLYRSVGVLNLVQNPAMYSMSRHFKDAAELAAGVLFNVRQKKIKTTIPTSVANIQKIKKSADSLLATLKMAKSPAKVELALKNFFEKAEFNETRKLWKGYEGVNYKKLRSLTAQIIMARSLSMLKLPTFEKTSVERASVAFLINRSFESLRLQKEKALKDKQLQMGLLTVPDMKMGEEKKLIEAKERGISFSEDEE